MKSRVLIISFLGLCGCGLFFSCGEKDYRHDEIISIPSEDTTISVKISYPEKWTKKDKIIIWSNPPLIKGPNSKAFFEKMVQSVPDLLGFKIDSIPDFVEDSTKDFLPDSIIRPRELWISPILRNRLLEDGYINIEFLERKDSVAYLGRKYLSVNSKNKAIDLANLLDYIQTVRTLKNKKIILIGYSEGGDVGSMVTCKRPNDVSGMIQLACRTLHGKELLPYQREQSLFDIMLILTHHGHQELMDKTINRMSSLDSYHTADVEGKGTRQYLKENIEPLDSIIFQHQNIDSVYYHLDSYLRDRWSREDKDAKAFSNYDFDIYYKLFANHITPHQINLLTINMEDYYPLIKCPVLAVSGTKDERGDCYPNIERMEQLLKQGGNENFQKMILEGYKHNLGKWNGGGYMVEDSVLQQILDWIDKL